MTKTITHRKRLRFESQVLRVLDADQLASAHGGQDGEPRLSMPPGCPGPPSLRNICGE